MDTIFHSLLFRFTTFLLKCKISNLEVSLCDEAIGSIFDEKFVREFSQIEVKEQQLDICLDTVGLHFSNRQIKSPFH